MVVCGVQSASSSDCVQRVASLEGSTTGRRRPPSLDATTTAFGRFPVPSGGCLARVGCSAIRACVRFADDRCSAASRILVLDMGPSGFFKSIVTLARRRAPGHVPTTPRRQTDRGAHGARQREAPGFEKKRSQLQIWRDSGRSRDAGVPYASVIGRKTDYTRNHGSFGARSGVFNPYTAGGP